MSRFATFQDFWPYYLEQHARPATRLMHASGSLLGLVVAITGFTQGTGWGLPVGLVIGYAFAWVSHFFVERNRPATFTYPLWSFAADWRMVALLLTGRLALRAPATH